MPKSDVRLATPSLDGTTLRIVAVNRGDAPATFIRARIHSDYLAGATRIKLRNDADAIIPSGSKLLTFDIIPLLDADQSYRQSMEIMMNILKKENAPETSIVIGIEEFDGRLMVASFLLDNDDLFQLLRTNAARCSAIESPNFENGCIGTGALANEVTSHGDSEQSKK